MALETRLKEAMLREGEILKTKVLTSLFNKEKEAVALKKEVLEKASTIEELEKVNEKQKNQVLKMRSLVQPLRDTVVEQAKQSQMEVGEMQVKVEALELKVNESEEKADLLTRKLEEKTRECLLLGEAKKSMAEELLAKVKSDCEIVKKKNLQIEKELENKRLERRMLTFEQHLGDLKRNPKEKHRRFVKEAKVGVKRKKEPIDGLSNNKKLKVVEHLKVMVENGEVANEEVGKNSAESGVDQTSVEEKCRHGMGKRDLKISPQEESRKRMSLVSEKGLWFLRSAVSTSV